MSRWENQGLELNDLPGPLACKWQIPSSKASIWCQTLLLGMMLPSWGQKLGSKYVWLKNRRLLFKIHEVVLALEEEGGIYRCLEGKGARNCFRLRKIGGGLGWEGGQTSSKLQKRPSSQRVGASGGAGLRTNWEANWFGFCCPEQGGGTGTRAPTHPPGRVWLS